nr:uncharacterized protein LOC105727280 [Aotus nancymaae]
MASSSGMLRCLLHGESAPRDSDQEPCGGGREFGSAAQVASPSVEPRSSPPPCAAPSWASESRGGLMVPCPQVPFPTMVALLCMWFGISLPLVYLGYYFGFRKQPYDNPVRTNQIPRQIPEQRWYMNRFVGILMAGILPFGAMFIELFFIFSVSTHASPAPPPMLARSLALHSGALPPTA